MAQFTLCLPVEKEAYGSIGKRNQGWLTQPWFRYGTRPEHQILRCSRGTGGAELLEKLPEKLPPATRSEG
jgi:hypothetical protein